MTKYTNVLNRGWLNGQFNAKPLETEYKYKDSE